MFRVIFSVLDFIVRNKNNDIINLEKKNSVTDKGLRVIDQKQMEWAKNYLRRSNVKLLTYLLTC